MYGLIHNPGFSVKEGQEVDPSFWGDETWSGHTDQVHAATYKDPSEGPGVPSGNDNGGQADAGGDPRAIGCDMAAERGWTGDEWTAVDKFWTQESNWYPNAVNPDSGIYGIPQSLGHGHPYDLGDAPAQIDWGLNYIADRYGDPATAEQHEEDDGWYSRGGVLVNWADVMDSGGVFRPGLNVAVTNTGGDEQLVPKGGDGAAFNYVAMAEAVRAALDGSIVQMDREKVGRLVTPAVSREMHERPGEPVTKRHHRRPVPNASTTPLCVDADAARRCHDLVQTLGTAWLGSRPGSTPARPAVVSAARKALDAMETDPAVLADVVGSLAVLAMGLADLICADTDCRPEDLFGLGVSVARFG